MKNPSERPDDREAMQRKLAGLGEFSLRKTYYPELQQRVEELERFKAFVDHSNDILLLVQVPGGQIVDVNESASRQLGWTRKELLTLSIFDLSDLQQSLQAERLISQPLADGGESALVVTALQRQNGEQFPAELTLNRMQFQDGTYVLAMARDITERQQLEEQLLQSQKMEAIGQLAGGVAHDFNNILMVIMGYADVLKMDGELAPLQKKKVEHIFNAAEKAARLTRSLLTFSRQQVMTLRTTELKDLVQQTEEFLQRIIGEDIQLRSLLCQEDLLVEVDSGQIEQVLINLATNARDAMPKGGTLTIETGVQVVDPLFIKAKGCGQPGRYAVISLSDTGMGMDEQTKQRIFEPFFTTKSVGKGTGLGMSIVYGIVKQHQGFMHVYSEPGVGTTFRIYLPLVGGDAAIHEPGDCLVKPPGGTETILVVEDEAAVRELVAEVLVSSGYQVILANDGQDAVAQFTAHRDAIKLILMDMIMPRLSGKEASDQILRQDPHARILFISGYTMDFIRQRDLVDERTELIMKPVQPFELMRKVRELLDRGVAPLTE